MSDKTNNAGRNARLAYQREWRKQNREKMKAYQDRYWERRAMREQLQQREMQKDDRDCETISDD